MVTPLEPILGTPERETHATAAGTDAAAAVRVLTFADQPVEDAFTLVSVGLEKELLLCGWNAFRTDAAYKTLFSLAQIVHDDAMDIEEGTLLEMPERSFLVWAPVYHDERLQDLPILWLIPVTESEATWIEEHEPDAFDALMQEKDPDLLDWSRESVV